MHDSMIGSDLRLRRCCSSSDSCSHLLRECRQSLRHARPCAHASWRSDRRSAPAGADHRQLLTESVVPLLGGAWIGVGAAILSVAPSLIPRGLLPATVTLVRHARHRLRAVAALVVGWCSAMPALEPPTLVGAGHHSDSHHDGRWHASRLLVIGEADSGSCCSARACCPDADRRRRVRPGFRAKACCRCSSIRWARSANSAIAGAVLRSLLPSGRSRRRVGQRPAARLLRSR